MLYKRNNHLERALALKFFRLGLASVPEIAELAGVTRQAVHAWARNASINTAATRAKHLRKLWDEASKEMAKTV